MAMVATMVLCRCYSEAAENAGTAAPETAAAKQAGKRNPGRKWHPGHYVIGRSLKELEEALAHKYITGWKVGDTWRGLEPERDTCDFSRLDAPTIRLNRNAVWVMSKFCLVPMSSSPFIDLSVRLF